MAVWAAEPAAGGSARLTGGYNLRVGKPSSINWDVEIAALQDLSTTAGRSHAVAAEALFEAFKVAADREGGALDQKILMAKLAAEFVSSLEDLGALAWAIRKRRERGALQQYVAYDTDHVRAFYHCVQQGMDVHRLLSIPTSEQIAGRISVDEQREYAHALDVLADRLSSAAESYLEKQPNVIKAYHKLKHGFAVIVRLNKLIPGSTPPGDWRNDVNILTELTEAGEVRYVALRRTEAQVNYFMEAIRLNSDTARSLVYAILFLWERGVRLDWRVPRTRKAATPAESAPA
jgi:hypothetical protein